MDDLTHIDETLPRDCARFLDIVEARIAGETDPSRDDSLFLVQHEASCRDCAAFSASLDLMADPEPVSLEVVRRVLDETTPHSHSRSRLFVAAGAGLVAACAVFLVYLGLNPRDESPPPQELPTGSLAVSGVGGAPVNGGDTLKTSDNPAIFRSEPVLTFALDAESTVHLARLDRDQVDLELRRGTVAAHLVHGLGVGMTVKTDRGLVKVTGTIFSVTDRGKDVEVGVIKGRVEVSSKILEGGVREVEEGEILVLGARDATTRKLGVKERNLLLALLEMPLEEDSPAEIGGGLEEGMASADAMPKEPSAGSGKVATGHRSSEEQGHGPSQENEISPAAAATPGDHIRTARELRKIGDWQGSAATYRKVLEDFPTRPEALTVLLPLAELELDHLGRADLALRHFGQYDARLPGGPLAEEAAHGKCLALRALGRLNEERRSLEEFLKKFPASVHTRNVRARLVALTGEKD